MHLLIEAMFYFSGLEFSSLTLQNAALLLAGGKNKHRKLIVATPNVNHVMRARNSIDYHNMLKQMDFLFADGMPIVWTSRLMGRALPERVTGADLLPAISSVLNGRNGTIFLAGATSEEELKKAKENLEIKYPQLTIKTFFPNYGFEISEKESMKLIKAIKDSSADVIFLGVGSPKQEKWLLKYKHKLPKGVYIGCGMAIGFISKTVKRAPKFIQKVGCEWIWRILQEPRRLILRYLLDLGFILVATKEIVIARIKSLGS